jgi:hypothetical protein
MSEDEEEKEGRGRWSYVWHPRERHTNHSAKRSTSFLRIVGSNPMEETWQRGLRNKLRLLDKIAVCAFASRPPPSVILSSSAVERSAVNRLVVGSNPTSGANSCIVGEARSRQLLGIRTLGFVPERSGDRRRQSYLRSQELYGWRGALAPIVGDSNPLGSCRSAAQTGGANPTSGAAELYGWRGAVAPIQWNSNPWGWCDRQVLTVSSIAPDGGLQTKEGQRVPAIFGKGHGYVVTSHKAQGWTADHVVIAAEKLTGKGAYVACSRGRRSCIVHTPDKARLIERLPEGNRRAALDVLSEMHPKNASIVNRVRARKQLSTDVAQHLAAMRPKQQSAVLTRIAPPQKRLSQST